MTEGVVATIVTDQRPFRRNYAPTHVQPMETRIAIVLLPAPLALPPFVKVRRGMVAILTGTAMASGASRCQSTSQCVGTRAKARGSIGAQNMDLIAIA